MSKYKNMPIGLLICPAIFLIYGLMVVGAPRSIIPLIAIVLIASSIAPREIHVPVFEVRIAVMALCFSVAFITLLVSIFLLGFLGRFMFGAVSYAEGQTIIGATLLPMVALYAVAMHAIDVIDNGGLE